MISTTRQEPDDSARYNSPSNQNHEGALVKTRTGDFSWEQATPSSYVHDAGDWSATVRSDEPHGPFRFQLTDAHDTVEGELDEDSESLPEMGDCRRN